jgi:hypothetical protein
MMKSYMKSYMKSDMKTVSYCNCVQVDNCHQDTCVPCTRFVELFAESANMLSIIHVSDVTAELYLLYFIHDTA